MHYHCYVLTRHNRLLQVQELWAKYAVEACVRAEEVATGISRQHHVELWQGDKKIYAIAALNS